MPLFEILIATVAPAFAKTVLRVWAANDKVAADGGAAAVDVLAKLIPEIRTRKEAERQLEAIGEKAAESLHFIFETEGRHLITDDQEAVANLVAQTLDRTAIGAELLLQKDLDPTQLSQYFITGATEQLSLFPEPRARLFARVIEEASQSIIDIARVLPNFSERTFAELLRRDRVLIEAAQRTLENLDRIRAKPDEDQLVEAAKFDTEYRRTVVRNLNKVELFGVDLSRASRSHPLSVAYVSLEVGAASKPPRIHLIERETDEDEEPTVYAVEAALAENQRLVIMGPAGAGKTTLLHWIAVRAASMDFEDPLRDWNSAVPFLIRLRHFGDSTFPRPEEFPSLVAPTIADTMPRGWVHHRLSSGKAVVMVDGVDEVAESRRAEVRTWMKDLVATFPSCRFIVTSRPHAVEQGWLESEGFGDADLQPMDTEGIETFIDHWHMAVAEEVQREEDVSALRALATNLKGTLRGNRSIRRLATNPLLCSVICALHRDTNEQLPEDRIDLYERCCSMLLERRDPESGLSISGYPRLTYRQKRSLLDDLAYWMLKNDWSEVSIGSAQDRLSLKIETLRPDGRDGIPLDGRNAMRFFVERSGILRQPTQGKLDFAHRTFQEFMAANAAVGEGDIGLLAANATNQQWREVVVLGAGLARPSERATLIQVLLANGDKDREHRPQLHLTAAACLDTAVDVDNMLRQQVESRIKDLFPPKGVSEAMLIADAAGEMAVPFLKRGRQYLNARQSVACVRGLAMIGSAEAIHAIADYTVEFGSVLNEVVRSSDRIDPGMFLELIAPRLDAKRLPGDAVARALRTFGIEAIPGLEQATELSLSGARAGDLCILSRLPHLHSLTLTGPAVTDLAPLRWLNSLTHLTLNGVEVHDLSPLQEMPSLRNVSIRHGFVDASQLAGVAGLASLSLWSSDVANAEELEKLIGLRDLWILDTYIDLAFLRGMPGITNLSLSGKYGDLSSLGSLCNLNELRLSFIEIPDVRWMASLASLETADMYMVKISDSSTFPLPPRLQKITIKGDDGCHQIGRSLRRRYPGVKIVT
jgi:Leucine-rich repeat (LRR) protein